MRERIIVSQGREVLSAKEGNIVSQGIKAKRQRKAEYCDPIFGKILSAYMIY